MRATPLPVSGDLENGNGDDPDAVAETVRLAAGVGLSGCSIGDTRMEEGRPPYGFDLSSLAAATDGDEMDALLFDGSA